MTADYTAAALLFAVALVVAGMIVDVILWEMRS